MAYVLYNKDTTQIIEIRRKNSYAKTSSYKTMSAAKAALTRMSKDKCIDVNDYAIADGEYYLANIEKQVTKVNMMTGKKYMESINTPYYCSPSSETYWSM